MAWPGTTQEVGNARLGLHIDLIIPGWVATPIRAVLRARLLGRKFGVCCDFNEVTISYGRHVPVYVIEAYLGKTDREGREARERGSRRAAAELTRSGSAVRFLEFLYVPEDELCLVRFEAPRREVVDAVAARAGLEPLRIVRALPIADGTSPT